MKTIEVDIKATVFDDPNLCCNDDGYCPRMSISECTLFTDESDDPIMLNPAEIDIKGGTMVAREKCLECRAAWDNAIEKKADDYFDSMPAETEKVGGSNDNLVKGVAEDGTAVYGDKTMGEIAKRVSNKT